MFRFPLKGSDQPRPGFLAFAVHRMTVPAWGITPNIALKLRFPILLSVPGKDDSTDFRQAVGLM